MKKQVKINIRKMILVLFFLMYASVASATVYYVDSSGGSDTNSGTSEGSAWRRIDCPQCPCYNGQGLRATSSRAPAHARR